MLIAKTPSKQEEILTAKKPNALLGLEPSSETQAFLARRIVESAKLADSIIGKLPNDAPPPPGRLIVIKKALEHIALYAKVIVGGAE